MALTSTIYTVDIDVSDADRQVYDHLALRVARHPSESDEYLLTRVLAYALEYTEGIAFTTGLSTPDEPAITVSDLTGRVLQWIDVGLPDPARLHRAAKAAPRVVVYLHRDPSQWWPRVAAADIYQAHTITVWEIDRSLLAALAARLERRLSFALTVTDRTLYLAIGTDTLVGTLTAHVLRG